MRNVALALASLLVAVSLSAADLGRADGNLTIDRQQIPLGYAYALGHQHNDITKRKDDTKVILTDKPLAADADLDQVEALLPQGMYAVIFNVASNGKITHVSVLHPKGSYDGGYLEDMPDFRFKNANGPRGTMSGRITSSRVQTNTMTFSVESDFNAQVR